jgi:hypothetical protein
MGWASQTVSVNYMVADMVRYRIREKYYINLNDLTIDYSTS